jgi:hypothetical protein
MKNAMNILYRLPPDSPIQKIMHESTSTVDALSYVKFQLSLLRIGSLGARTPQAEELEMLLTSGFCIAPAPK